MELVADEIRYVGFASNLSHGYYSPAFPNINLWSGPGYPIVLWIFHHVIHLPYWLIRYSNAIFMVLSVLFVYKSLVELSNQRMGLFGSGILAFFYPIYQDLPFLLTETLVLLLVSISIYLVSTLGKENGSRKYIYLGVMLGILTLVKVIFGLVIPLVVVLTLFFSTRKKKIFTTAFVWFLMVLPWLFYTQQLTSRIFYWGNAGGMSLYWMSSPAPNEYGDWNNETFTAGCKASHDDCNAHYFEEYHAEDMARIKDFPSIKKDDAYKQLAISNIKNHPVKFIKNIVFNWSRMLFGMPFSYTAFKDKTLIRLPAGLLVLLAVLYCSFNILKRWKERTEEQKMIWLFLAVYLGGSSLLSAYPRMLNVVIPVLTILTIQLLSENHHKKNISC